MIKNVLRSILDFLHLRPLASRIFSRFNFLVGLYVTPKIGVFKPFEAPDHLPLPPAQYIYLVSNQHDAEVFYQRGVLGMSSMKVALEKNGLNPTDFCSVFDFGCGCGRVIRQWKGVGRAKLYGSDYNPSLIEWCQKFLPFAEFKTNKPSGGLPYQDNQFDFIYALSVFTHFTEDLQYFWMREITRVLKPGGHLYITVHGRTRTQHLTPADLKKFNAGEFVIVNKQHGCSNFCGAYHPEAYIREKLCRGLRVVDIIPEGAKDSEQDVVLIQKPL